jgi:hypothetical protein
MINCEKIEHEDKVLENMLKLAVKTSYLMYKNKLGENEMDDIQQQAILVIMEKYHRFDETKGHPMGFVSSVLQTSLPKYFHDEIHFNILPWGVQNRYLRVLKKKTENGKPLSKKQEKYLGWKNERIDIDGRAENYVYFNYNNDNDDTIDYDFDDKLNQVIEVLSTMDLKPIEEDIILGLLSGEKLLDIYKKTNHKYNKTQQTYYKHKNKIIKDLTRIMKNKGE